MINEIKLFFSKYGSNLGCVSAYIVGSYANNTFDILSDLDLVVIGENDNSYMKIKKIGVEIRKFFLEDLNSDSIFYCEPSQELLCLLNPENLKKMRVHLIYHPFKRFERYIQEKDQVLVSWKSNCKKIYGADYLASEVLSRDTVDPKSMFSNTVNLIIQNLHNSYLLADISSNYTYYLKLYKFILKRLREIEDTPAFKSVSYNHNFLIKRAFVHFQHLLNSKNLLELKESLVILESLLLDLEKQI